MRRFGPASRALPNGRLAPRTFGAALLVTASVSAAELPGAHLTVQRAEAAIACPTEDHLATLVQARLGGAASGVEPLAIDVVIAAEGTGFSANISVRGRRHGERVLRADGPTCDGLSDALVVALLLMLDDAPDRAAPLPVSVPPPRPEARSFERAPSARRPTPLSGWLAAGALLTHGLPTAWSMAAFGDFGIQWRRGALWLGGFWSPERAHAFAPGSIALQAYGARFRGCYLLVEQQPNLRLSACVLGVGAALRGRARGFTADSSRVRPWWLLGVGPDFRWRLASRLALGASLGALLTPHRESFTVENLGRAYTTDSFVGWAGVDANFQIW